MLAEADTSEANSYLASHISVQIHMEQVAQLDQNETAQLQNMCYKKVFKNGKSRNREKSKAWKF